MATLGISDSQSEEVNIEDTQDTSKSASVPASTNKRRKNRSEVWDHFEKLEEGTYKLPEDDDYKKGKCKGCNSVFICDSRYGSTNLKRHIKACVKLQGQSDLRQMLLNASLSGNMSLRGCKMDNNVYREKLTRMIVRHELPFLHVEYEGVRDVHEYLNSDVKHITRNTCKADMFKLYQKSKCRIKELLSTCPSRVSLTTDF